MKRRGQKRRLSAGTVFMLVLLAMVLAGSALVLTKLSSGASVDLNKLNMSLLDIQGTQNTESGKETGEKSPAEDKQTQSIQATLQPTQVENSQPGASAGSYTLTFAGSVSLDGELRKNSWNNEAKVYDYSDMMMLIGPQIRADVSVVFTENLYCESKKYNDTVAPESAAALLKDAGFSMAACGFSQAYSLGKNGIETTLMTLTERGIAPIGLRYGDDSDIPEMKTPGGIRSAFLQYTDTVVSKTRKTMEKDGTSGMVPEADPEQIAQDISIARERGAAAVIVLINWGKDGKEPDKAQHELAVSIAKAGADLIIGNGSHVPQTAEYLSGQEDKQVLCIWSLGSLLNGDRSNAKHMSGYLLHVTIRSSNGTGAEILNPEYTPVYTWKYKQDGRYYYRSIAADGQTPDGMDSEQIKGMNKAAEIVNSILKGSPLTLRRQADEP